MLLKHLINTSNLQTVLQEIGTQNKGQKRKMSNNKETKLKEMKQRTFND